MKDKVHSPNESKDFFDIVAGVLLGDTLAPYLFIIYLDYVFRTTIDLINENGFTLKMVRRRPYSFESIIDAEYADNKALLANVLPKPNLCCIPWIRQQKALVST